MDRLVSTLPSGVLCQDSFAGRAECSCPDGRVEPRGRSKRSWQPKASTSSCFWVVTYVVASEVVNGGLAQHGEVLDLRLAQRGGVSGDKDELGLGRTERLEGALL